MLKAILKDEKWFKSHGNVYSIQDGLAWVGSKIYVLERQTLLVLGKSHNSKSAGYFGFVKTLLQVKGKSLDSSNQ